MTYLLFRPLAYRTILIDVTNSIDKINIPLNVNTFNEYFSKNLEAGWRRKCSSDLILDSFKDENISCMMPDIHCQRKTSKSLWHLLECLWKKIVYHGIYSPVMFNLFDGIEKFSPSLSEIIFNQVHFNGQYQTSMWTVSQSSSSS